MRVQRILHPTDFRPWSLQALPLVALLARTTGAELHLLHVEPSHAVRRTGEEDSARLAALARDPALAGLAVRTASRGGASAAAAILEYAGEHAVDLVVMGSRDIHGNVFQLLRSDALEVAQRSPCSVLTLEPAEAPPRLEGGTLLVPFDHSFASREALRWAADLATHWRAGIVLLHVIEESRLAQLTTATGVERMRCRERCQHQAELQLADVAGYLAPGVPVSVLVRFGDPAHEILGCAATGIDLVVMASTGMTAVKRLLLGSVAEAVQRSAAPPVLIVRAEPCEAQRPRLGRRAADGVAEAS